MSKRVLVIDDEHTIQKLVASRLEASGYQIVAANDGLEGLAKLKSERPDLIVLDIQMPTMDGYTFLIELKKLTEFRNIPVIVLTAKDKMEDLFRLEGVKEYLVKPFQAEDLLIAVKKHIG